MTTPQDNTLLSFSQTQHEEVLKKAISAVLEHNRTLTNSAVAQTVSAKSLHRILHAPLPDEPRDPVEVIDEVLTEILPNITRHDHPGFLSAIPSPSNPMALVADILSVGHNIFNGYWRGASGPAAAEEAVIAWFAHLCRFSPHTGGLFVSGGSMANLTALVTARHTILGENDLSTAVFYITHETHSCFLRAARMMGIPLTNVRKVASDSSRRMDPLALTKRIIEDKKAGLSPFAVVVTLGSTNTGTVDHIPDIATVAKNHGLWLHGDGAFGAAGILDERNQSLFEGIELLDSITLDPHKWWFQSFEAGVLLVQNPEFLRKTFKVVPDYLLEFDSEEQDEVNFYDYGFQVTRSFRALKMWMSLQTFGLTQFRQAVVEARDRAQRFAETLHEYGAWEILSGPQLAILTFRYLGQNHETDQQKLNEINASIAAHLNKRDDLKIISTKIDGLTALRVCLINPRITGEDETRVFEALHEAALSTHASS